MAGGAVQQNGIFSNPHHHNQQPHMESDPPDSRKRPLETPTEASSTKRTNTGGKEQRWRGVMMRGCRAGVSANVVASSGRKESRLIWFFFTATCYSPVVAFCKYGTSIFTPSLKIRLRGRGEHSVKAKKKKVAPLFCLFFNGKETMTGTDGGGLEGSRRFPSSHML